MSMILSHWHGGASRKNSIARTEQRSKTMGKNRSTWFWVTDMVEPAARIVSQEQSNGVRKWARIDQHDPESLTWWSQQHEHYQKKRSNGIKTWAIIHQQAISNDMVEPSARTLSQEWSKGIKKLARIDQHDPESLTWWSQRQKQYRKNRETTRTVS